MRARPTCSCAAARPGASSRSSPPATPRAATCFGTPSPSRWRHGRGRSLLDDAGAGSDAGSAYVFVRSGTTWSEAAEAHGQRRGSRRRLRRRRWPSRATRPSSGAYGDDITERRRCGRGLRLRAQRHDLERAGRSSSPATRQPNDNFGRSVAAVGRHGHRRAPIWRTCRRIRARARPTSSCATARPGASSRELIAMDAASGDASFGQSVALCGRRGRGRDALRRPRGRRRARARPTSSCAAGRSGASRPSSPRATPRAATSSAGPSPSSGDTAVVGAREDDPAGLVEAGSAYVFRLAPAGSYCTAGTSASGCQATLSCPARPAPARPRASP